MNRNSLPARRLRLPGGPLLALTASLICTSAEGADIAAGKTAFRQQCTLCHTAEPDDNGGAQGPSLIGVFGRPAASSGSFGYTKALQDSHLTWDQATLDRFLASPSAAVPGTAMPVSLADPKTRANVVAYLQSVKDAKPPASASTQATP